MTHSNPQSDNTSDVGSSVLPRADADFHRLSAETVLARLRTQPEGLNAGEATRRRATYGANRLPEPPARQPLLRFAAHFHNLLIYVLIASAVVTAALGHLIDTGVILAVVIVNAVIGFIQEGRAEQAMAAIRGMLAPKASILRGGERQTIDAAELVPGDIVLIEAGDRVPADLRLVAARGLKAEEAVLTGESVPVDKATPPVTVEASLGDRRSMLFSGTMVVAGDTSARTAQISSTGYPNVQERLSVSARRRRTRAST